MSASNTNPQTPYNLTQEVKRYLLSLTLPIKAGTKIVLGDALWLARLLIGALDKITQGFKAAISQALLTVTLFGVCYGGSFVIREQSLSKGLFIAFLQTEETRLKDETAAKAILLQAELRVASRSDLLIKGLLTNVLKNASNSARVRLATIHNGVYGLSGPGILRWDITHAVAEPGKDPGTLLINMPLSQWSDYLTDFIRGNCKKRTRLEIKDAHVMERWNTLAINTAISCPVIDLEGRLLGGVFLSWDREDEAPPEEKTKEVMLMLAAHASQVAAALSLRAQ